MVRQHMFQPDRICESIWENPSQNLGKSVRVSVYPLTRAKNEDFGHYFDLQAAGETSDCHQGCNQKPQSHRRSHHVIFTSDPHRKYVLRCYSLCHSVGIFSKFHGSYLSQASIRTSGRTSFVLEWFGCNYFPLLRWTDTIMDCGGTYAQNEPSYNLAGVVGR